MSADEHRQGHPDRECCSGTWIPIPGSEGGPIPDGVQSDDGLVFATQHLPDGVHHPTALGTDRAGKDLHGIVRRLVDGSKIRIGLAPRIAEVAVVDTLTAVEVEINSLLTEAVPSLDRPRELRRIDPNDAGEFAERQCASEPLGDRCARGNPGKG